MFSFTFIHLIFILISFMLSEREHRYIFVLLISSVFMAVFTGRWLMSFWTGSAKIHELYTAACGLYVCWLSIRAITVLLAWMPQGRRVILLKVQEWTLMVLNSLASLWDNVPLLCFFCTYYLSCSV